MFRDSFTSGGKDYNVKTVQNLDAALFYEKLKEDENAVLIDVRTPMEHQEARIPNSLLLDISDPNFIKKVDELDRTKSYYLYCRSGNRSFFAGKQMIQMGFDKVYNLLPGVIGWKYEIEK